MSSFKISGTIEKVFNTQEFESGFSKREFVIKTLGEYPQTPVFQFVKDKCNLLDKFKVGQLVDIEFNLRARSWKKDETSEERYFNTLEAWRINEVTTTPQDVIQGGAADPTESDDLPF